MKEVSIKFDAIDAALTAAIVEAYCDALPAENIVKVMSPENLTRIAENIKRQMGEQLTKQDMRELRENHREMMDELARVLLDKLRG